MKFSSHSCFALCPGFYHHPQSVPGIVDFVVPGVLDHLEVKQELKKKWDK